MSRTTRGGGAARAATRIWGALNEADAPEVEYALRTMSGTVLGEHHVVGKPVRTHRETTFGAEISNSLIRRTFRRHPSSVYTSPAIFDTGLGLEIESKGADVINFHWLGDDFISIQEIGRLRSKIVFTLHDMWAFSGAEHIIDSGFQGEAAREIQTSRREIYVRRLKQRAWTSQIAAVAPSQWIAEQARESEIGKNWRIEVIPNPIDANVWRAADRLVARTELGIPASAFVVLFGAVGGLTSRLKGGDLFLSALAELSRRRPEDDVRGLIFGGKRDQELNHLSWPRVDVLGQVDNDRVLMRAYSAADVVMVPSRIENLPYVALEAQACSRPVVAFDVGGIHDAIVDCETGFLVQPFNVRMAAEALEAYLRLPGLGSQHGDRGRVRVSQVFSPQVVANQYTEYFKSIGDTR